MKEIAIFTESEKTKAKLLLKAKENGDHEAAVEYIRMKLNGCRRALEEYKKHSANEKVTPEYEDVNDLFYDLMCSTVSETIKEIEKEIKHYENWIHANLIDW